MDQRLPDLDGWFAGTDPGAASEPRLPLVVSPAPFQRWPGEDGSAFAACHVAPSVGEHRRSQRRAVIESGNA
jgi:hypothetical protein